jgi:signal transduction histidine kinase
MAWRLSVASVLGLIAAALSAVLALYSWRHREKRMALQFIALEVTLAAWSLGYAVQLGFGTLAEQLLWQRITLGIAGFVPTVWLLFAFAYTSRETWLSWDRVLLLITEPLVWLLLCLTNPVHELLWREAALTSTLLGPVSALEFGLGYAVHITYAYAIIAIGIGLIMLHATKVAPVYQKQASLLVIAALPAFLSHIAFTLGRSPVPALDLTPFAFAFTGITLGLGLFKFDLLQLAPIAREQAFHEGGDGLIIVNGDGKIVDVIGVASTVLDPSPRIGDPFSAVFPDTTVDSLDATELTVTRNGNRRVYQYQVSPVSVHHDHRVGTLIVIRDITGLYESRQRLSVTNRVLRHNLRNDMNVVLGYASRLEDRLEGRDAADARRILTAVEGFLELTRKAEQMAHLDDGSNGDFEAVDVVQQLQDVVSAQETDHPAAAFTVDSPRSVTLDGVDPRSVRIAVENLVDNAVTHNDSETPRVTIAIEDTREEVRIEISDNGPGIPETEKEAIGAGMETALDHSQGLGLWLTHWCAERWGGELSFEADEHTDGTTVTLTIPRKTPAA